MESIPPDGETAELFRTILANQQSLHDDTAAVLERLNSVEKTLLEAIVVANDTEEDDIDDIYPEARQLVVMTGNCSVSMLQRMLRIGYTKAVELIDLLEMNNIVGPKRDEKPREVLMTEEELELLEAEEANGPLVFGDDELYEEAKAAVIKSGNASTSLLQRVLKVGYSRAARLVDLLEQKGVVGPGRGSKPREVIAPDDDAR